MKSHGVCIIDGKIGVWPFVEEYEAKRASVNCPAGTLELRGVKLTCQRVFDMLQQNVLPRVKMREQARQASELAVDIVMEFFLGDI